MVSIVAVIVKLVLLVIALFLILIGYEIGKLGLSELHSSYKAVIGSKSGLEEGHVKTEVRAVDGPKREGPLGTTGHIQRISFSQKDWTNLLDRHKKVSEEVYDSVLYDEVILEDKDLNRETLQNQESKEEYERASVKYVNPDWTRTTTLSELDDVTTEVSNFVSEHDISGGGLREALGAFESVKVREASVGSDEQVRVLGKFNRSDDGSSLVPAGEKVVFSDSSWRRLSLTLFGHGMWHLLLFALLLVVSLVIGYIVLEPLIQAVL